MAFRYDKSLKAVIYERFVNSEQLLFLKVKFRYKVTKEKWSNEFSTSHSLCNSAKLYRATIYNLYTSHGDMHNCKCV